MNYTYSRYHNVRALAEENNFIWAGASVGLVKIDKVYGTVALYNTSNSGLPDNDVTSIVIDISGNKWIGTNSNGLIKFDGTKWTVYNTSNSGLPNNNVQSISIDGSGNKWIGTSDYYDMTEHIWVRGGGLAKFDGINWAVYTESNSDLPSNSVQSIAIDGSGNKWIGTSTYHDEIEHIWKEGGLAKFDGINWTVYDTSNSGLPENNVQSIAIDGLGNKWIGTGYYGGLAKFDGTNWTVYNTSNSGLNYDNITSIAIDGFGNKWIGSGGCIGLGNPPQILGKCGGLAKFDGINWTVYKPWDSGLPDYNVNSVLIDGSGNKWIGTHDGLVKFDDTNWILYNPLDSVLPSNYVESIVIDGSGNKWIGTAIIWEKLINFKWIDEYGGLAKFDGINWTVYNTFNSDLPDIVVVSIAIDKSENKWIGTPYGGLAEFDGVNWTVYDTTNSDLPDNYVGSIAIDDLGNKWMGTTQGLAKFDDINWTVYDTSNSGLPSNFICSLAIDGFGNKWIGTFKGGLAKFDGTYWTVYDTSNSDLPYNNVYSIAIDDSGNKWIGTWGLAKFDDINWTVYNTSNSDLPASSVVSIAIDSTGNKWIVTKDGGLVKFDDINWTVYNTSNSGLPENSVTSIAIDGFGNKWIGTDSCGLAIYHEEGVVSVKDENIETGIVKEFILYQNYPNPFNASTEISYSIKRACFVTLKIYNVLGQEIKTIVNGFQSPDFYHYNFTANEFPSSIYLYELETGTNYRETKKMILLR